jgi:hypothetical protein
MLLSEMQSATIRRLRGHPPTIRPAYQLLPLHVPEASGVIRRGLAEDEMEKVLAQQGALSGPILSRCRIRHFTDGVACA